MIKSVSRLGYLIFSIHLFLHCCVCVYNMSKLSTLVCILLMGFVAIAQQTDSLLLREVTVTSSRFDHFSTGIKTQTMDSVASIAYRTQTLAELLGSQSQVFIKSYGPGLATSSFRGAGAAHTAVLWKGFNLQNPMFGEVDFSLINGDVADKMSIQYGGNGALFGSGAVGGIIQLQSTPKYKSGFHASIGTQIGSFEHLRKQASLSYGNAKWYTSVKWFELDAQNNFTYTNVFLPDKPQTKLANAQLKQTGWMNEHSIKLTNNQELSVNFWYQYADRNIPPTMSVPQQKAYQQDETFRTTAEWKVQRSSSEWMIRSAYFDESIQYEDPSNTLLNGANHSKTNITEAEVRVRLHAKHSLNIGVNNTYALAYSTGYGGWKDLNRTSLFASYKTQEWIPKVTTTVSIREERVAGTLAPVMPSAGVEWKVTDGFKVFGNVSRSYRVPTLNEQYWITGVVNALQPETGWTEELSATFARSIKKVHTTITLTGFNRTINNWIIWQPVGANWAPQNIKSVWSRGLEGVATAMIPLGKLSFKYTGSVNLVLSTNNQTQLANDGSIDKQLIYVPRVTQQHQLTATYGNAFIAYTHQYTGIRFITTDNSQWLDDYQLASVSGGKTFCWKKYCLVWSAQVVNLYNISYQAIADRPMPGRHFFTTITIKI